jgi:LPPG:FO 2-phospho-L-lactate transferase
MSERTVILSGGVGGAKLVLGLTQIMPANQITAIVSTGDDFSHLGLCVSPDIDTLLFTLSGKANRMQGWGREDESWSFTSALRSIGGPDWFALGDGDLAMHILRTNALAAGKNLSTITAAFAKSWQIGVNILPITDHTVVTMLSTDEGELAFQDYFVRRRCLPIVDAIRFEGAEFAMPAPGVLQAITDPLTQVILIASSNPYLSVDPIFAVPSIRLAFSQATAPIGAVSPLSAVKR